LTDEQQTILILRFVERKSHEEVADILGKSERAVATAQHRALKKLATLLGTSKTTRHYIRGK
jgi:RNA polymerase sigma-70 factor (ECF subfamily)